MHCRASSPGPEVKVLPECSTHGKEGAFNSVKAKWNGFVAQKGAETRHCPLKPVGAGGSKLGQAVVLPFLCLGVLSTAAGMGQHPASRTSRSLQKKKLRGLQGSPPGSGRPLSH